MADSAAQRTEAAPLELGWTPAEKSWMQEQWEAWTGQTLGREDLDALDELHALHDEDVLVRAFQLMRDAKSETGGGYSLQRYRYWLEVASSPSREGRAPPGSTFRR